MDDSMRNAGQPGDFRPYAGILSECRGMLEARAGAALVRTLSAVEEDLQARRAEGEEGLEQSIALLQAQSHLTSLRQDAERRFRLSFARAFDTRVRPEPAQGVVYGERGKKPELSLVADEQVSEQLAFQYLTNRLLDACQAEIPDLEARAAFMLGTPEIDSRANPLGPAAICEALREMCAFAVADAEARQTLLELVIEHFRSELATIYHEVNELLIARRILPLGRPWMKRQREDRRKSKRSDSAERRHTVADVLEKLQSPYAAANLPPHTSPAGTELMHMLTRLQRGDTQVALGEHAFSVDVSADGTTNVLDALLKAGLGNHLGVVDGIVIDVVATLFDYIFDDDRVPAVMKGLIGRLQIPVLKLAMIDHSFFSSRSQPARRLINDLAQAAITWDGEFTTETPLYQRADKIVRRIQEEFAENAQVFAACLAEFEHYLSEQERVADERAAALTARLEARERYEIAREAAQKAIVPRAATPGLPEAVRIFLMDAWTKVLAHVLVAGGENGAPWQEACAAMDELVWSVLPKEGSQARKDLVQRLPGLLKGLRAGCDRAQIDASVRDTFLTELVKLHAAAVKAGMQPPPEPVAPTEVPLEAPLLPTGPSPRAAAEEQTESFEVDMLRRGDWVELSDESGTVRRVRLTWISPARTMYLFANRQGQRALALTRSELVRRFARREAVTASDEALLDRLVDNVFENYQSNS